MYSFSYLEPVCCSMSSSNCCFLTCIQISQEAGHVVWYTHLFQNFPQFIVIPTVKGFGIVNKAEVDVFSGNLLLFRWMASKYMKRYSASFLRRQIKTTQILPSDWQKSRHLQTLIVRLWIGRNSLIYWWWEYNSYRVNLANVKFYNPHF